MLGYGVKSLLSLPRLLGFSNKICQNEMYFLVVIFNQVSRDRINAVGPDRACAEWLMRNGALIRWTHMTDYIKHYNALPLDLNEQGVYLIKEVDASDAGISHHGFDHFDGCKHIDKIKMYKCPYIRREALVKLNYLKDSLIDLEITHCYAVSGEGLSSLKNLINLKSLKLGGLAGVKNFNDHVNELKSALPNCDITVTVTE